MRRALLLFALLACAPAVAGAGDARRTSVPAGTVYVTERQLGSVTAYDAATGKAVWTTKVGATPIGVAHPTGTDKLYTSDEGFNQLSVLDRRTGDLLKKIPMGPMPHHMMASRYGDRLFVAEFGKNEVGVVDTRTDTRLAGWTTNPDPSVRTHSVWITRNGKDLYAADTRADRTQPGDVAHLDAHTGRLLCNTMVGVDPSEILVTPDGKRGFVSVRGEHKIKELDVSGACPRLTGREAVIGTMPDTLRRTSDGKTLVVTLRGTPAQISLLDTKSFTVRLVDIPGHTTTGHHWLSPNGRFTFVAVESPAGVAVVDNTAGTVVADYPYPSPPGGTRAHGVFYEPTVLR
jgi:DNA-binding beta-propeller fold protein YncE